MPQENMFIKGYSIIKPQMFNNFNFTHWKARMEAFIMAHDMEGWMILSKGLNVPINEKEWDENHLKLIQENSKVMNMLYCVMNDKDFKNIATFSMAKEI